MNNETDILVAGGGIAGMLATLVLANTGHRVLCVDPSPPTAQPDLRSTAFLMPSVHVLESIGVFQLVETHAAALLIMRIVDAGSTDGNLVEDFVATEAGANQFGWNVPNEVLRHVLPRAIEEHPNATLLTGVSVQSHLARTKHSIVRLSDGSQLRAQLVVAADGRNSSLRESAGIPVKRWSYGQKALVFQVSHDQTHDGVSTEVHKSGGPFTLVPLAGDQQDRSAVVWMDTGPKISELLTLPPEELSERINDRSSGVLGSLTKTSPHAVWPIISQYTDRLNGPRLAIIGEAAHVVPPIGAQGLNMSLSDVVVLADLIGAESDPGTQHALERFHRKRWLDMRTRVQGIDALNRASMAQSDTARSLRRSALGLLKGVQPVRKLAVSAGLGQTAIQR